MKIDKDIVLLPETENEAKELIRHAYFLGYFWSSDISKQRFLETHWADGIYYELHFDTCKIFYGSRKDLSFHSHDLKCYIIHKDKYMDIMSFNDFLVVKREKEKPTETHQQINKYYFFAGAHSGKTVINAAGSNVALLIKYRRDDLDYMEECTVHTMESLKEYCSSPYPANMVQKIWYEKVRNSKREPKQIPFSIGDFIPGKKYRHRRFETWFFFVGQRSDGYMMFMSDKANDKKIRDYGTSVYARWHEFPSYWKNLFDTKSLKDHRCCITKKPQELFDSDIPVTPIESEEENKINSNIKTKNSNGKSRQETESAKTGRVLKIYRKTTEIVRGKVTGSPAFGRRRK